MNIKVKYNSNLFLAIASGCLMTIKLNAQSKNYPNNLLAVYPIINEYYGLMITHEIRNPDEINQAFGVSFFSGYINQNSLYSVRTNYRLSHIYQNDIIYNDMIYGFGLNYGLITKNFTGILKQFLLRTELLFNKSMITYHNYEYAPKVINNITYQEFEAVKHNTVIPQFGLNTLLGYDVFINNHLFLLLRGGLGFRKAYIDEKVKEARDYQANKFSVGYTGVMVVLNCGIVLISDKVKSKN